MPDDRNLQVLRECAYEIKPTCGLCRHARFDVINSDAGTCINTRYFPDAYGTPTDGVPMFGTSPTRYLTIHRAGYCEKFDMSREAARELEPLKQFVKLTR